MVPCDWLPVREIRACPDTIPSHLMPDDEPRGLAKASRSCEGHVGRPGREEFDGRSGNSVPDMSTDGRSLVVTGSSPADACWARPLRGQASWWCRPRAG